MSLRAMVTVLDAGVKLTARERAVLFALANHANDGGGSCGNRSAVSKELVGALPV